MRNKKKSSASLKEKPSHAPILAVSKFSKYFDVQYTNVGIEDILMQEGHKISNFSKKLKGIALNYSTYDK